MRSFASELDFWHFDGNLMVFKDGSLGAGFQLAGFDMTCATEEAINQLSRGLENLLISAAEGVHLQLFYQLTPNVTELIDKHQQLSSSVSGNYRRLAEARVDFYRKNQAEGNYFVPNIFFFVRSKPHAMQRRACLLVSRTFSSLAKRNLTREKQNSCVL